MGLVDRTVGQGVHVGGQTGRRRGVYTCDMVVDTSLFCARFRRLLDKVYEVRRAEFSKMLK